MFRRSFAVFLIASSFSISFPVSSQHSVARQWNEVLLDAIRVDFARPTVHSRNLFHSSMAMYDIWAAYDPVASTYLLGKTVSGFYSPFDGVPVPVDVESARKEAISYAMYRLLTHRFKNSPGVAESQPRFDSLMTELGYDKSFISTDYWSGSPAAFGNFVAQSVIDYGLQDGAHEGDGYKYYYYYPVNEGLDPTEPGAQNIQDPNRWQPLVLESFIDQSGNPVSGDTTTFVGPEWGEVVPFAMSEDDLTLYHRNDEYWDYQYRVYNDPGPPPYIDTTSIGGISKEYKWSFILVSIWSAHLDPTDGVMWDISPGAIGNNQFLPETIEGYRYFYDLINGGDPGPGWSINPYTAQPYEPQIVPRGDYARVLAEFWADGPDSETPPGHWFTILNYVSDHSAFEKRYEGEGPILDDLEWDVKAYFTLGGAVHDAAVSAWGIKGWYDYVRPISAIRFMADLGQSTDPNKPNYHPGGIPLIDGYIELVHEGDVLAGVNNENVNKIKLKAWRGPDYILIPEIDVAGVGWILAENWWPYQRPSFVTPPFAGYISGHSTFSRAAAEVMTLITGDEYFPGGMGEFPAKENEFLVFEDGPSMDVTLQWATYRDASDQTSLSRIWGGIHPPADDIPGRWIGIKVGTAAFQLAKRYFLGEITDVDEIPTNPDLAARAYPNPIRRGDPLRIELRVATPDVGIKFYNILGQQVTSRRLQVAGTHQNVLFNTYNLAAGVYLMQVTGQEWQSVQKIVVLR